MAFIQLRDLSVTFNAEAEPVHALRHVDLEIEEGDLVAIVGRSGSGKSTLANVIGLLLTPSGGGYQLDGRPVGDLSRHEAARVRNERIGFVFQRYHLMPRLTALENVCLPLTYRKHHPLSQQEALDRAGRCLDRVGLADRADHWPTTLSGGEQQRVAIARAIVNDPSVLLADEPTGALDTANGDNIADMLQTMSERDGRTVVVITHDERVAGRCRRQIRIRDGRLGADMLGDGILGDDGRGDVP